MPQEGADLGFPLVEGQRIPWLSVEQMREVDRLMVKEVQITLVRMMENAGSCLAELARRLLGGEAVGERIAVLAGPGGNGGGGLVAARHLANSGAEVGVCLSVPGDELTGVPAEQLRILERLGVPVVGAVAQLGEPALVIDAVLGYSQQGDPRGAAAELIEWAGGRRVLALDTPSGLELTTGLLRRPHIRAEVTMTLALPKEGLRAPGASAAVGNLHLADISVPSAVYRELGLGHRSPFSMARIVRLGAENASVQSGKATAPASAS